jgi:hypothetical protein
MSKNGIPQTLTNGLAIAPEPARSAALPIPASAEFLTAAQVAQLLQVSQKTVRR